MEEDQQNDKYQILLWSSQHPQSDSVYPNLLVQRDTLWRKMDYRAYVSRELCEMVSIDGVYTYCDKCNPKYMRIDLNVACMQYVMMGGAI